MKSNKKTTALILIILGIIFVFLPIITTNLNFKNSDFSDISLDKENLKISKVSGPIHIDDANPSMNWSVAKKDGICTGNGTYSEPYVIEDLVIDGGGSGSCILIESSGVYFRIENCTVFNSEFDSHGESLHRFAGIRLMNVMNAQILDNNCSFNSDGIVVVGFNNTIAGNTVNNNSWSGIFVSGYNNTIVGNTAKRNNFPGIYILVSNYTTVSENIAKDNTHYGILVQSSDYSNVSGNNVSSIYLYDSDYNIVSGNTAYYAIALDESDYNLVSGNDACCGEVGGESQGNTFSDNGPCPATSDQIIPGYNLFFLLGVLSFVAIFISKKVKKS